MSHLCEYRSVGAVIYWNGTTTLAETVSVAGDTTAANLFLGVNPFYREFTTPIPLTAQAQALPEMRGSGWVWDLREIETVWSRPQPAVTQSSTRNPSTRSNSRVLWVMRVASSAKAWQAIHRSFAPMGVPAFFSRVNCSA